MFIVFSGKALRMLIMSKSAVGMNDVFDRKWRDGLSSEHYKRKNQTLCLSDPANFGKEDSVQYSRSAMRKTIWALPLKGLEKQSEDD